MPNDQGSQARYRSPRFGGAAERATLLRGKEPISVITFVLVGIIALFVLAGIVTVNDGVHGRL